MPEYKWTRTLKNITLCDIKLNPNANASIDFNNCVLQINFNKPLIVTNKAIYFGLSMNKKNINKRLPFLEMNISKLQINMSYQKINKI